MPVMMVGRVMMAAGEHEIKGYHKSIYALSA
jgi:hypothetical protein